MVRKEQVNKTKVMDMGTNLKFNLIPSLSVANKEKESKSTVQTRS
jgi:hypothetical protein